MTHLSEFPYLALTPSVPVTSGLVAPSSNYAETWSDMHSKMTSNNTTANSWMSNAVSPNVVSDTPEYFILQIEEYFLNHPEAIVLENARVLCDMRTAHYSVNKRHKQCFLEFWDDYLFIVRTIVGIQVRDNSLRLITRSIGSTKSQSLILLPDSQRSLPTDRDTERIVYQRLLERALKRHFPDSRVDRFRSTWDRVHSLGPQYARGLMFKRMVADAVIGVGSTESPETVDGILTAGILWLDYCRHHTDSVTGGLKVIVPECMRRTMTKRMVWLNHNVAKFELYTLDELREELVEVSFDQTENQKSRIVHNFSNKRTIERCQEGLDRLRAFVPVGKWHRLELISRSSTEVELLLHGLIIARVHHRCAASSFDPIDEITFGSGVNETQLNIETEDFCKNFFERIFQVRGPDGVRTHPLFRTQPECWLEARIRECLDELFPSLNRRYLYSPVEWGAQLKSGVRDLLTIDRSGRLVLIEIFTDDEMQLLMQAIDGWIRVQELNEDREPGPGTDRTLSAFERNGYFTGTEVSSVAPRLTLTTPALRIHRTGEIVLRYLSPIIEWELIGLNEHWRHNLTVLFRKRSADMHKAGKFRGCNKQF